MEPETSEKAWGSQSAGKQKWGRQPKYHHRHEAELGKLRSDTGFIMFMDTPTANPELGVIPGLRKVAAEWSAKFQEGTVTSPLRIILMMALIREMMTRLENFMKDPVKCARAEEIGGCHREKKPIKLDQQPLQTTAIQAQLQVLEKAVPLDGVLTGFKSTKDLELDLEGEVVPMMGAVGHRAMTLLSGNAVCKLVGMRMRPERLAGQPAAKQLEENFIQATVHGAGGGSSAG
eukprot:s3315_g1.t1